MKLIVISDPTQPEYLLLQPSVTLGSAPDADIQLKAPRVYPYHATIWQQRGLFAISDWNNQGGVLVNNRPAIGGQPLWPGDRIQLGDVMVLAAKMTAQPPVTEVGNRVQLPVEAQRFVWRPGMPDPANVNAALQKLSPIMPVEDNISLWRILHQDKPAVGLLDKFRLAALLAQAHFRSQPPIVPDDLFPLQRYAKNHLREDTARLTIETTGFQRQLPIQAIEIDMATALVVQVVGLLFAYNELLETLWQEQSLLKLAQDTAAQLEKPPTALQGLNLQDSWAARCPLKTSRYRQYQTYPQFRRQQFNQFFESVLTHFPPSAQASIKQVHEKNRQLYLPAFANRFDLLTPQQGIRPLWLNRIAVVAGGRYYLINLVQRDQRGRMLAFKLGKPDDPGQPITLSRDAQGQLIDQRGRQVTSDAKGYLLVTAANGTQQLMALRPNPASIIKAQMTAILQESKVLGPAEESPDTAIAELPMAQRNAAIGQLSKATQANLGAFDDVPVVINWDLQDRDLPLHTIRKQHRGLGDRPLVIFRTDTSLVFDFASRYCPPHLAVTIAETLAQGAANRYLYVKDLAVNRSNLGSLSALRLQNNPQTLTPSLPRSIDVNTISPTLATVLQAGKRLQQIDIRGGNVRNLLLIARWLHAETAQLPATSAFQHWLSRQRHPQRRTLLLAEAPRLPTQFPVSIRRELADLGVSWRQMAEIPLEAPLDPTVTVDFLTQLAVVMAYLNQWHQIAGAGKSATVQLIKTLWTLHQSRRHDDLNHQIHPDYHKSLFGNEVFCYLGKMPGSTAVRRSNGPRFDTVPNQQVWTILGDNQGNLRLHLRDFSLGQNQQPPAEAYDIAQNYVDGYAKTINIITERLVQILGSG